MYLRSAANVILWLAKAQERQVLRSYDCNAMPDVSAFETGTAAS